MKTITSWIPALTAAFLAGGIGGYVAGRMGDDGPRRPASPVDTGAVELRAAARDLVRAAEALAARSAAEPDLRVRAPAATPAELGGERLATAFDHLAARIDALGHANAVQQGALESAARLRPPDVDALRATATAVSADWKAAQSTFHFLTPSEILRRFGPPTYIAVRDGAVRWFYEFKTLTGKGDTIVFTFSDGMVVRVES